MGRRLTGANHPVTRQHHRARGRAGHRFETDIADVAYVSDIPDVADIANVSNIADVSNIPDVSDIPNIVQ
ncbi:MULTISPECIES: hypothetical protein [Roseobacteraceae]|uniref:hypothetical protein n=1 Tax=Roseobacteraceae TaxID=2854170 RepID=UPI00237A4B51|nr:MULTISPECIES: hypothetical protein [Marinovum]MDD9739668.1 hypothetical protein [Marinovum sp. SP66]